MSPRLQADFKLTVQLTSHSQPEYMEAAHSGGNVCNGSLQDGKNICQDAPIEQQPFSDPTNYLIISASGKPVFSQFNDEAVLVEYGAIIQAIIAVFDNSLRSFHAKNAQFVVSSEFPLILVAIDRQGQSEAQLRTNLDILHAQILSTLTKTQLTKAFEARPNRDLRPLLEGTEIFLNALCSEMNMNHPGLWLGAIEALALKKHARAQLHSIFMDHRSPGLLYGLVISDKRLVSVIRPRRHSLHPTDLFLLFSMLFNTNGFQEGEHWMPICFPRFNSNGFLYTYIRFVAKKTAIVLVSPDKNAFFEMQTAGNAIAENLESNSLIRPITESVDHGRIRSSELKLRVITHFLYKSKRNVQFAQSAQLPPDEQSELMLQYKHIQAFAQQNKLTIQQSTWRQNKIVLGWFTPGFDLYCVATAAPKDTLNHDLRKLISWVKNNEERIFIVSGATF